MHKSVIFKADILNDGYFNVQHSRFKWYKLKTKERSYIRNQKESIPGIILIYLVMSPNISCSSLILKNSSCKNEVTKSVVFFLNNSPLNISWFSLVDIIIIIRSSSHIQSNAPFNKLLLRVCHMLASSCYTYYNTQIKRNDVLT